MPHHVLMDFTFWHSKSRHDSLNQTQDIESTATHVRKEKHDPNASTKLWTQGSADHVWGIRLRNFSSFVSVNGSNLDTLPRLKMATEERLIKTAQARKIWVMTLCQFTHEALNLQHRSPLGIKGYNRHLQHLKLHWWKWHKWKVRSL